MTALDIITLLLVGGASVFGFMRGLVTEALSFAAWVLAIIAVKLLHEPMTYALEGMVGTWGGAAVLSFSLVFGITFIIGRLIARKIGDTSKASVIGGMDRVLGLGFGALKGLIAASLIFLLVSLGYDTLYGGRAKRPDWMTQSRSYPLLNASSRALVDFVEERRKNGGSAT
jgi:membrane protein required for colicin V production